MNDKEFADKCHLLIHSLRLVSGYKPTIAEVKLSQMVIERFKDECEECKRRGEELKSSPNRKGIISKITEALEK